MPGRQRRDAHIDWPAADAQCDAPVLRQTLLGNIKRRHDLDARNQRRVQRTLWPHDVAQCAVDSEAHQRIRFERFDMDIGCAVARGLRQQRVDHADDRRVVLGFKQVLDVRNLLHHPRDVELAFDVADDLLRRATLITIRLRDRRYQLARLDDDRLDLAWKDADDFVQCGERGRVADPDLRVALGLRHQQNGVITRKRVRNEAVGGDH